MEVHIYSIKAKSQAGNIRVKDIMTTQKDQTEDTQLEVLKIYAFCQKTQKRASRIDLNFHVWHKHLLHFRNSYIYIS